MTQFKNIKGSEKDNKNSGTPAPKTAPSHVGSKGGKTAAKGGCK